MLICYHKETCAWQLGQVVVTGSWPNMIGCCTQTRGAGGGAPAHTGCRVYQDKLALP